MSHPAHIVAKKLWLEEHGHVSWTGFKDGNATGGSWSSNGRRDNAFVITISAIGSDAIINTLYDLAKKHLANISNCGNTDE